jgi:hypothetical protein
LDVAACRCTQVDLVGSYRRTVTVWKLPTDDDVGADRCSEWCNRSIRYCPAEDRELLREITKPECVSRLYFELVGNARSQSVNRIVKIGVALFD